MDTQEAAHCENTQHLYHHQDTTPRVAMKVEKNTKGYNWEVSVSGAGTIEEALRLLKEGNEELRKAYGGE